MDRFQQFSSPTFLGEDKIAASVDYRVCDRCGFRLMRVETTIINDQHLSVARCPICERFDHDNSGQINASILAEYRNQHFDIWLSTHGLDRNTLECHYHLTIDHFFDDE